MYDTGKKNTGGIQFKWEPKWVCKKGKQEEGVRFLALKLQEKQIKTFNGVWGKAGVFLTLSSGFILIKIKILKNEETYSHSLNPTVLTTS